jgi:hypothetical protein
MHSGSRSAGFPVTGDSPSPCHRRSQRVEDSETPRPGRDWPVGVIAEGCHCYKYQRKEEPIRKNTHDKLRDFALNGIEM